MTSPAGGGVRALRTLVLAAATLGLAAAAHRVGGGELPGPGAWALVLAGGAAAHCPAHRASAAAAGCSPRWLLEWGLHEALAVLAAPVDGALDGGASVHQHGGALVATAGAVPGAMPAHGTSVVMLAAHALATVLTAGALAHAERALWAWWEAVRPALVAVPTLHVPLPAPVACPVLAAAPARLPRGRPGPRGPPARG